MEFRNEHQMMDFVLLMGLESAVNHQIKTKSPPYVVEAHKEMIKAGLTDKEAKKKLTHTLWLCVMKMLNQENLVFPLESYESEVRRLLNEFRERNQAQKDTIAHARKQACFIKVWLKGHKTRLNREMMVPFSWSVAQLAQSVLATMHADAGHLYTVEHKDILYDCGYEMDDTMELFSREIIRNAESVRLCDIPIQANDKMIMMYDFGEGWEFEIKIESFSPIDSKLEYPYLVKGKGGGILEDNRVVFDFLIRGDEESMKEYFKQDQPITLMKKEAESNANDDFDPMLDDEEDGFDDNDFLHSFDSLDVTFFDLEDERAYLSETYETIRMMYLDMME